MGKGDKRTKRGKIFRHSFGNSRPQVSTKKVAPRKVAPAKKKTAAK